MTVQRKIILYLKGSSSFYSCSLSYVSNVYMVTSMIFSILSQIMLLLCSTLKWLGISPRAKLRVYKTLSDVASLSLPCSPPTSPLQTGLLTLPQTLQAHTWLMIFETLFPSCKNVLLPNYCLSHSLYLLLVFPCHPLRLSRYSLTS